MPTDQILNNSFFAFFHSTGDPLMVVGSLFLLVILFAGFVYPLLRDRED